MKLGIVLPQNTNTLAKTNHSSEWTSDGAPISMGKVTVVLEMNMCAMVVFTLALIFLTIVNEPPWSLPTAARIQRRQICVKYFEQGYVFIHDDTTCQN